MAAETARAPRQNRVDPWGELIAHPARGALTGNRGVLHDERGRIRRTHRLERWIVCLLDFKGRRRRIMQPGRWTELFFWDEATALAAGHRPCAECQRQRFDEFRAAWASGNPGRLDSEVPSRAPRMDRVLHGERIDADGRTVTYAAALRELPDGAFVAKGPGAEAQLLWEGQLWPWRPDGYGAPVPVDAGSDVRVLTPRSTVAALAHGFRPRVRLPG